jgi:hypothetical protein
MLRGVTRELSQSRTHNTKLAAFICVHLRQKFLCLRRCPCVSRQAARTDGRALRNQVRVTELLCERKHAHAATGIVPACFQGIDKAQFRQDWQTSFPIDLQWRRQKSGCDTCLGKECAMSSKTGSASVFVALSLATAVAMMSLVNLASERLPGLRALLLMSAAPEAAASAGAVGQNPEFPVSP